MRALLPVLLLSLAAGNALAWRLAGNMAMESRVFFQQPLDASQYGADYSVSMEPEFSHQWDDDRQSLVFRPFARLDRHDDERSHWDIRELQWVYAGDGWEARLGVGRVYWGVTEAVHLVDIINQTDLVENIDGEQKLGQPMVKLSLEEDWGTLDFFLLPGFRERTFPGEEGRLRSHSRVEQDLVEYESSAGQRHVDYALRWSHYIGEWDMGLAWFQGTGRDPLFRPGFTRKGELVLAPFYEQTSQASVDLQATLGEWLWKLEAIYRNGLEEDYYAFTGGFEYTRIGILDTAADLGVIAELVMDERGDQAATAFNHDVFLGLRWTANDAQSLTVLAGAVVDWENGSTLLNLEASRRFGQAYLFSVQLRSWLHIDPEDLQYIFRQDDYLQVELARYF